MKRKLLLFLCFLTVFLSASAKRTGTMNILGTNCSYDTITHRHIAPGATLTTYSFDDIRTSSSIHYNLVAHVIAIDMTNPYNNFTPKLSKNGYYHYTTILDELKYEQSVGKKAVASISGFAFTESGNGGGTTKTFEVYKSMIGDGVVYHQDRGSDTHYYFGADRLAYVGTTTFSGVLKVGSEQWTIGQVNRFRDLADNHGEISLFCNGLNESQASGSNFSGGTDVKVRLINASKIYSGEDVECEVISIQSGCGHGFNNGEAILSAAGTAEAKLKTLSVGQKVTISLNVIDADGNKKGIHTQIPIFAGRAIRNGVTGEGADLVNTATVILGASEDHKTTYIGVIDAYKSKATYRCLADLMRNIGAYNGIYLDGGPSVDMAVDDKIITHNLGSPEGGRGMGSAIMLYSMAPNDNSLASLEVDGPSVKNMNVGTSIDLKVWGYNQYGEMIAPDALKRSEVELSCTNDLGFFSDNKFTATKIGNGEIVIGIKNTNFKIRIPLKIEGEVLLDITPSPMFTGEERPCQAKLWYTVDGVGDLVDPSEAQWSTDNNVLIKSCTNGLVVPNLIGGGPYTATLYAKYLGKTASVQVIIEDLDEDVESINLKDKIQDDTKLNYQLKSVPRSFVVLVETTPGNEVKLNYRTAFQTHSKTETADSDGKITFDIMLDYDKANTYPVTINNITSNNACKITDVWAVYSETSGVDRVTYSEPYIVIKPNEPSYNLSGQRINLNGYRGIIIQNGKKVLLETK